MTGGTRNLECSGLQVLGIVTILMKIVVLTEQREQLTQKNCRRSIAIWK